MHKMLMPAEGPPVSGVPLGIDEDRQAFEKSINSAFSHCLANQQVDLLIVLNFHQTNILLLRVCSDFLSRVSMPINTERDIVLPILYVCPQGHSIQRDGKLLNFY